ncbi:hypothetical protein Taro_009851 [Colocasia esculenta]|uniref:Uncharacterized protein n=1 Tax=Colocasia esculenta TaxID=4460 RepID=A0A843U6U4_COLES|nr:hypothetical protein [Colocasia esculenta]
MMGSRLWRAVVGVVLKLGMTSRGVRRAALAPAPVPQEHGHGGPSIMERFKRMAPPSFKGESQPLLVESWMREVEKIFWAIRRESMFGGPPYYIPGMRMVPLM